MVSHARNRDPTYKLTVLGVYILSTKRANLVFDEVGLRISAKTDRASMEQPIAQIRGKYCSRRTKRSRWG